MNFTRIFSDFCYSYVSVCYSCVSRLLLVCVRLFRMLLVCYSYVTRMYSCGVLVIDQFCLENIFYCVADVSVTLRDFETRTAEP